MGRISEESINPDFEVTLSVVERQEGETRDQWRMISVDFDCHDRFTPKELRILGKWLYSEGKRIGKEYKSNGAKK